MLRKSLICLGLSIVLYGSSVAEPINTLTIAKDVTMAALKNPFGNFMNYHVEGVCFWLHWSLFGPYVTTTLKVSEFLPDAIVSVSGDDVFRHPRACVW